jgi:hypothetical protein
MKYIKTLQINLKQFLSINFKDINIYYLIMQNNSQRELFEDDIKNNFKKIKNFVKNNNQNDFPNVKNFSNIFLDIIHKYLKYVYDHNLIDPVADKEIIFKSPDFCNYIINNRKQNEKKIKIFDDYPLEKIEDAILKNVHTSLKYAIGNISGPWKKLEELDSFSVFDNDNLFLRLSQYEYLEKNIFNYYVNKFNNKDLAFLEILKNPKQNELLDDILINGTNHKFKIFGYVKELMIYLIKGNIKIFGEYYRHFKFEKNINLEEIDKIIFNYPDATIKWIMLNPSPFKNKNFIENRDNIETMFIKDIKIIDDYLSLFYTKKLNIDDFFDRRLDDIVVEIMKIKDENELGSILSTLYPYLRSYIDVKVKFKNKTGEFLKQKYPELF